VSPEADRETVRHLAADFVDSLLEVSVIGSFSRLGFTVRHRMGRWGPHPRIDGQVFVVTGASSGIGKAVGVGLAALGADLILVGRDEERLAATVSAAADTRGGGRFEMAQVDLADPESIGVFARRIASSEARLDGLIHCAGALFEDYRTAPDGTELTIATHLLAPFRLSLLLSPLLRRSHPSHIITVSSGGMYTQRFDLDHLEATADDYRGAVAYARAKRAQVVLAHEWARRWGRHGVASYAMHPGWVATPGLTTGLPSFARLGPLLRSPAQGADTAVWLTTEGPRGNAMSESTTTPPPGGIWLDRRRRSDYRLPQTYRRPADRRRDGEALWEWCLARMRSDPVPPES
jgi:dehydrogenase/reductase SDR family member 12